MPGDNNRGLHRTYDTLERGFKQIATEATLPASSTGHVISTPTNRPSEFIDRVNQRAADGRHVNFVGCTRRERNDPFFHRSKRTSNLDGAIEEKEKEWCNEDEKTGFTRDETKFSAIFQMPFLFKKKKKLLNCPLMILTMRNDIILIFRNDVFVFNYLFINQKERDKFLLIHKRRIKIH